MRRVAIWVRGTVSIDGYIQLGHGSEKDLLSLGSGLGLGLGFSLCLGLGWRGGSRLSYNHTRQESRKAYKSSSMHPCQGLRLGIRLGLGLEGRESAQL